MSYYTNSNLIKELMLSILNVDVKPMEKFPEKWWSDLTLYIFDDHLFRDRALGTYRVGREENAVAFRMLLKKRPDWGGMILEMMKKSQTVHVCYEGIWYRVYFNTYGEGEDYFQFMREKKPPVMQKRDNCLISTEEHISREMDLAITELLEPIRFGQGVMRRLFYRGGNKTHKKAGFAGGDYTDLCLKLETLTNDIQYQRNLWKDRFFFQAMDADEDELCEDCKESMREAFYDNVDEFEALRWRPGDGCGGVCRYCSRFIEDLDDVEERK